MHRFVPNSLYIGLYKDRMHFVQMLYINSSEFRLNINSLDYG